MKRKATATISPRDLDPYDLEVSGDADVYMTETLLEMICRDVCQELADSTHEIESIVIEIRRLRHDHCNT